MVCPKCGTMLNENERMCIRCGNILQNDVVQNNTMNTNTIEIEKSPVNEKSAVNRFLAFCFSFLVIEILVNMIIPNDFIDELLIKKFLGMSDAIKFAVGKFNFKIIVFYILEFILFFVNFYLVARLTIHDIFRKRKTVNFIEYGKLKKLLVIVFPILYIGLLITFNMINGFKFSTPSIILLVLEFIAIIVGIACNIKRIKIS